MLKAKPSPYPWLIAAGLTALIVGSLFRGYAQTHVGFFRMFGTIGLVLIGYFATRTFYALQEGEALDRLAAALKRLPPGFEVGAPLSAPNPRGRGRLVVDLTVIGPRGLHLVAIDPTRPYVARATALARQRQQALALWQARRQLEPRLEALGRVPVGGLLLTLYRSAGANEHVEGLPLAEPHSLPERLAELDRELAPEPLPEQTLAQLRAWLAVEGHRP